VKCGVKYLFNRKFVSIDIGNQNTKILIGSQNGNNVLVEKTLIIPTPTSSFHDGRITDKIRLKSEIARTLLQNKIKAKKAIFTIESTAIITRELVLPSATETELDNMIRFEIEQYLPINLNDYVLEYKLLEKFKDEEEEKVKILVAGLPKSMAEDYLKLVEELDLKPLALDMNSNAVSKLFSIDSNINDESYSLDKTVALIDLGHNYINLSIISKGIPQLNRLIVAGGKDIDISIANHFNLSLEEAEMKKKEDVNLELISQRDSIVSYITSIALNDIARDVVDDWLQEIQKLFQYYTSRNHGNRIDQIYIYGGSSNLKGLSEYFYDTLNIPTFRLEKMSCIKEAKNKDALDLNIFLNCVGAIIRK